MKKLFMTMLVAALLGAVLTGCAQQESTVKFKKLPSGEVVAELWVDAPEEGCSLEVDTSQDVVFIKHSAGKTALPDTWICPIGELEYLGEPAEESKVVSIALYHLVSPEGLDIDYYKRRFARNSR